MRNWNKGTLGIEMPVSFVMAVLLLVLTLLLRRQWLVEVE